MPEVVNVTLKRSDAKLPDTQVSNTDAIRPLEKADHITLRKCIDRDEAADVQVSEEHKILLIVHKRGRINVILIKLQMRQNSKRSENDLPFWNQSI